MLFRQFKDPVSSTFTYIIACERSCEAVIIDPVLEQADLYLGFLSQHHLHLSYSLETHIHADHLTAAALLKHQTQCQTGLFATVADKADLALSPDQTLSFGDETLICLHTPGHTDHDLTFQVKNYLFTGDSLLIEGCGRTDFQAGSNEKMWHSVTNTLFSFPDETLVYPGHDYRGRYVSCILQEKTLNPRFARKTYEDFQELMKALTLEPPRRIAEALPFNASCGQINQA